MTVPVPPDPYSVLGVPREASQTEVSSAFRALVRRYHPDTRDPSQASDSERWTDTELRSVLAAYRILRDPTSRAAYDRDHPPRTFRPAVPQTPPWAAEQEDRRRQVRVRRWATPRASDLFMADPFYASAYFADPNFGDSYFVRIIR
jgi:curved DNA-binding protein CbpA